MCCRRFGKQSSKGANKGRHDGYRKGEELHLPSDIQWYTISSGDLGLLILTVLFVILGAFVLIYAVAFAFANIVSLGEVAAARKYRRKTERLGLEEREGRKIAGKLSRTTIYFTSVLLALTVEEGYRYIFHTGSADSLIWAFRIVCFALFILITGVLFVRLYRWMSFKSSTTYQKTINKIKEVEKGSYKRIYEK